MKRTYTRYSAAFLLLAVLLLVLLVWNVMAGSGSLTAGEVLRILFGMRENVTREQTAIVWTIRLPRILAAVILGGALSVSGFLLQTFFANPIAGPFVLGISSGAKLVVSLVMIFLLSRGLVSSSLVMIAAAFVGAMISMGFILLISQKVKKMSMLIILSLIHI